jgi:hypothetical protein
MLIYMRSNMRRSSRGEIQPSLTAPFVITWVVNYPVSGELGLALAIAHLIHQRAFLFRQFKLQK